MRIRNALVITIATVSLLGAAGCTSDKKSGPSSSATPPTTATSAGSGSPTTGGTYCQRLIRANATIATAQTALYTGNADAVDTIVTELKGLQVGAPAQIKTSLADMITAFQQAGDVIEHPTSDNQAKLASLMQGLSTDSAKVAAYAASKCVPK